MVEPLFAEKKLTYDVAPVTASLVGTKLRADREKVQQILLNLLSNAIKFTQRGGNITISATACMDAPPMACIHVRDSGMGIPASKLDAIFEPFVQLSRTVSDRQGVGLGLAISRDLARQMGGDIMVVSSPDHGSTFTLTLPCS
jgi:signal transduction histidine kinase